MNINILSGDCVTWMDKMIENGIQVDLTVTSPPYDDLRTYEGTCVWNYDKFKEVSERLYKITKDGGIVVWVVGDATVKGGETGSSFKQALGFIDVGFKLHDTMIYEKNSSAFPARRTSKRYTQIFEYMFVFVKGKIRNDISLIADKPNKWAGFTNWGKQAQYDKEGNLRTGNEKIKPVPEFSLRNNIWRYTTSCEVDKTGHPAVFPQQLAEDHILSWTVEGDTVFDPFLGSGTTGKMAVVNKRNFIGTEIVEDYINISKERIGKYTNDQIYLDTLDNIC